MVSVTSWSAASKSPRIASIIGTGSVHLESID